MENGQIEQQAKFACQNEERKEGEEEHGQDIEDGINKRDLQENDQQNRRRRKWECSDSFHLVRRWINIQFCRDNMQIK